MTAIFKKIKAYSKGLSKLQNNKDDGEAETAHLLSTAANRKWLKESIKQLQLENTFRYVD